MTPRVVLLVAAAVRRRRRSVPGGRATSRVAPVLVGTVGQPGRTGRRRRLPLSATTIKVLLRLDVEARVRQTTVVVASDLCKEQQQVLILILLILVHFVFRFYCCTAHGEIKKVVFLHICFYLIMMLSDVLYYVCVCRPTFKRI